MSYDPETNKRYLNDRYAKQRADMISFLGGVCVICGTSEGLEIDHIDWSKKELNVSALWPVKKLGRVYQELAKCQLLCFYHHMAKTKADHREMRSINYGGFKPWRHGTTYGFMQKKCRCDECEVERRRFHDVRNAQRRLSGDRTRGEYGRPAKCGEILSYRRGCKCDLCRAANSDYAKTLRSKKNT